ncbi:MULTISPECIES: transcriptional regulator FtrA [unclassified Pseudomonas]|uniref:transcriptional regulator FtrA n=1 Tax=unclassified Pseudomonas TaxID=196821 RepID=UPI0008712D13|nr:MULTISPECIES: transcriptional regulator FtrA [unclassified Pseudomonas]SCW87439.1 AraC family transcriptional regulator, transcriptional activator FtrA [Pseudomonas sp. NFACC05-1]SCZ38816.1 AraC family transcriptional regulator, transcriptional activator FtrA [Pseudomonas sp. NFACC44-2]SDA77625.1 AraC family transcriptional regulator, transcriptional activator FtrA [Pseudomonas sp. NFACC51]SDW07260.1 AraC family transcriptional regulator, transcriptional activator FtrA [Pseudomonas sp. NFACC
MLTPPGTVAILAYEGLCVFEFGIALEIFGLPRPELDIPWYTHQVVAVDQGPMRAFGGLQIGVDAGLEALETARTIIVPGWRSRQEPPPEALLQALRKAHARGARLLSICSGVFVLAATGLLDGETATTHWQFAQELAEHYPLINVDPNVLYVDAGQLITSAGSAAGIDACLHLIARDCGTHVANSVARRLVMAPQRTGGQAQFIVAPVSKSPRNELSGVLQWIRENLDQSPSVGDMAARVAMSERTFLRRFIETTGLAPKAWLQQERLNRARELLESTDQHTASIAQACGYRSVESFRAAFRNAVGLPPSAYRERFGRREASPQAALKANPATDATWRTATA